MRKILLATILCMASTYAHAVPTFVGSYQVNDGPIWTDNPPVYSATEAAALIFGGDASDYFISTDSSMDYTTITHTGWYDGWGDHVGQEFDENYSLDLGAPGYAEPGEFGAAYSAYVLDGLGDSFVNYVWLADAVDTPAPGVLALLGLGLAGFGFARRKS